MIDPIAFYLGTIAIRWYGIIISFALLVGTILSIREAKSKGIDEEIILDLFIVIVPTAVIGARLYYIIFNINYYLNNPWQILAIRSGGLAIHGAVLGGVLASFYFTKKRKVSFWKLGDIIAPYLLLGQAIGRWGNFINQEAHGGVVTKQFISLFPEFIQKQMYINGFYYHPAFLYESVWNILVFVILIFLKDKPYIIKGDILILYAMGYSLGRFFIEGIRTDSLMLGPIRVAQLVSVLIIIVGVFFIYYKHNLVSD